MAVTLERLRALAWKTPAPVFIAGLAFLVCFWRPIVTLGQDWWSDPDAGHGLLLFPVSVWLGWKRGLVLNPEPQRALGLAVLIAAVLLRYLSGLAAELFTMRASLIGASMALIVYLLGVRQLVRWWLPTLLIILSVPLPAVVLGSIALPLQLTASQWGAALLEFRHVPVRLAGNVIQLPGQTLFVTEACSGLRSLTSLIALGLLVAGLWLRRPWLRVLLVLLAIPVAMVLNAVRVFITGFLVFYVDPKLAQGVMHLTEGWVIFVVAFAILGALAFVLTSLEKRLRKEPAEVPS
jgi:exosortase